ncbi:alpha/beta hydrolase [Cryobacterium sp. TMS1-20-1]|uniref:alpha/beta fold hydrolase n=1 Tax=Cryobacterium sp. TMS1-20-1 TaxID=1259223 RepID=UPI00106C33C1|nr:alpha/beta hydrolase [Cryobacterium sp. TMS1-20-1]
MAALEAPSWMTFPRPWNMAGIAAQVADQIRSSRPGRAVLVGHSTGGAIALQLALDNPELVDALVLVGTGQNMHSHGDVEAIIQRMEHSWGRELFETILDRSFAEPLGSSERESFLDYADRIERRAAIEVLTSQRATDFSGRLAEISCPAIVIHGMQDRTRTSAQAEALGVALGGAPVHFLSCGHSAMFERPDETATIMRTIL